MSILIAAAPLIQAFFAFCLLIVVIAQVLVTGKQAETMKAQKELSATQTVLTDLAFLYTSVSEERAEQDRLGREITTIGRDVFREEGDREKLVELAERRVHDLRDRIKEIEKNIQPAIKRIGELELQLRKSSPFDESPGEPENA